MRAIYKYPIEIIYLQQVEMPRHSAILHAGLDPKGQPCIWAMVDTDPSTPTEMRDIIVAGTGAPIPDDSDDEETGASIHHFHLSSFIQHPFVWHVLIPIKDEWETIGFDD